MNCSETARALWSLHEFYLVIVMFVYYIMVCLWWDMSFYGTSCWQVMSLLSMVSYCTLPYVMTWNDYVMYKMNENMYCIMDTCHDFKLWGLMHIVWSLALRYFTVMISQTCIQHLCPSWCYNMVLYTPQYYAHSLPFMIYRQCGFTLVES